jgi:DNA-binding response OmpR family regulator
MGESGGVPGSGRILVVEDDAVIARHIVRALSRLGYCVQGARSCAEARAAARGVFRCGVFDIELGDGDGVALAEALLGEQLVRKVVFYTGSLDPHSRRRALAMGSVVDKPLPFGELLKELVPLMTEDGS